jgi:hypothetical protein
MPKALGLNLLGCSNGQRTRSQFHRGAVQSYVRGGFAFLPSNVNDFTPRDSIPRE